ncbi:type II toxin-antitoxin system HicA family toxin [bacterium]|nr:type II toxin-antitoxin system HicA family toxin [bacterium]
MKMPRDIGGEELAKLLEKCAYKITRQTGSHIRLTTMEREEYHITIPKHKPLRVGTLNSILGDVAMHLNMEKQKLIDMLFGR